MDHDLLHVRSPESVAFDESFRPELFEAFVVILDALVEGAPMRLSGAVDRAGFGHGFLHRKTGDKCGSRSQGGLKRQEVCHGGVGAGTAVWTAGRTCPGAQGGLTGGDRTGGGLRMKT